MKILNLFAGIGGNRTFWGDNHEITAVEFNPEIAKIYQKRFPNDEVIVGDAFEYLEQNYMKFEFIWGSPPCPTHTRICTLMTTHKLPDMRLYGMIIFLQHWFKGKWVVENVVPYYDYLIRPGVILGRHPFWSNYIISPKHFNHKEGIDNSYYEGEKAKYGRRRYQDFTFEELCKVHKVKESLFDNYKSNGYPKTKVLRNCVLPEEGKYILDCATKTKQKTLF